MRENIDGTTQRDAEKLLFRASAVDFNKIPGSPIAYSASKAIRDLFSYGVLSDHVDTRLGMATADNGKFLRLWFEVSQKKIEAKANSRIEAKNSTGKWFPYQKGGDYRKWFGNLDYCVNWEADGLAIQSFKDPVTDKIRSHNYNLDYIFRRGVTWNALTSGKTSARLSTNSLFDNAGSSLFVRGNIAEEAVIGLINSNVMLEIFPLISPTLNYQPGDISKLPAFFPADLQTKVKEIVSKLIEYADIDWDAYETSWDFATFPLLSSDNRQQSLNTNYQKLRIYWRNMTLEMQRLEEENNRIFINAYGLQDELAPEVPLNEITLTCNPHYRYGGDKSEEELEVQLLADTMRELVSYAVGCMFGRYALEKPGLILANQGETLADYLRQVPKPSFLADDDNVIPLLDGDWFTDDITLRFRQFLRVALGDAHYEDNLAFMEQSLNLKGKRNYSLRDYFLGEFYADHVKRYKKRPIYWLFSSPKGSFNALIYLHRYRSDTVSIVLQYLRDFRSKLVSERDHQEQMSISTSASQGEKTKALKRIEELKKIQVELDDYERDTLYPMATRQVLLDLDDGVKVNYLKLGAALKKIPGLDAKDED